VGTGSHAVRLGALQPAGSACVPAPAWANGARLAEDDRFA
jgi:hypothetical protein